MIELIIDILQHIGNFLHSNWPYISALGVFIAGLTFWIVNIYKVKKLRLEIRKLREDLEKNNSVSIPLATLDEIIEFVSKNPNPKKLHRFLNAKFSAIDTNGKQIYISIDQVSRCSVALEKIETSFLSYDYDILWIYIGIVMFNIIGSIYGIISSGVIIEKIIFLIHLLLWGGFSVSLSIYYWRMRNSKKNN